MAFSWVIESTGKCSVVDFCFFEAGNTGNVGKVCGCVSIAWKAELEVTVDVARGLQRTLACEVSVNCLCGA